MVITIAKLFQLWRQSSHLHEGTIWTVSHLLPIHLLSFHSHYAQERTHHLLCKNYSHCGNLSLLLVSGLASSPERGAGRFGISHTFELRCCYAPKFTHFPFKRTLILPVIIFYHLPPKLDHSVPMSLLLPHGPSGGLQLQALVHVSGMSTLCILEYQWMQPNAKP